MAATSIDLSQIKTDALDSKATFKTLIEASGEVSLDNLREYFPTIANNATDAEHDLDIGAARIWVSDGTDDRIVNFAAEVKRIDAAWAAGTNEGGLDTGTVANSTWYYVYAIYNPTTDVAGYLLSASASSPTMPSGYTYKRLLCDEIAAAVLTDGSANVLGGRFIRKSFFFNSAITEFSAAGQPTVSTARIVSVPQINCIWLGSANVVNNTNASSAYVLRHFDVGTNAAIYRTQVVDIVAGTHQTRVQATGGQIKHLTGDTLQVVTLNTQGYEVF